MTKTWIFRSLMITVILVGAWLLMDTNQSMQAKDVQGALALPKAPYQAATFAGGCFWCMEQPFDKLPGVISTTSGYTGGPEARPTYEQVGRGQTSHTEAVRVVYDPRKISYDKLLDVFWRQIDPTTLNRQFVDVGTQYRTGIYTHNPAQQKSALASKAALEKSKRYGGAKIVTEIKPAGAFWAAEDYHQNYYQTHAYKYKFYRFNSGRDQYLEKIWGKEAVH